MNSTLERLKAEEAEEETRFSAPVEPQVSPQDTFEDTTTDQSQDEREAAEYMEDAITAPQHEDTADELEVIEEEVNEEQPKRTRTNWKRRFINFKASADTTIYQLRQEVSQLIRDLAMAKEENMALSTKANSTEKDIFADTFSQEDVDTFGTEGLDVVKKATRTAIDSATKPLKDQLKRVEQDRINSLRTQAHTAAQAKYAKFIATLESLVPNYTEVNVDRGFLEWMKLPDTYSGITRASLFTAAEDAGDAGRVAEFFVEYSHLTTAPKRTVSEVDKHITPVGNGSASSTPRSTKDTKAQPVYQSEIDAFYRAVSKGEYAGRHDEVLAIEAEIDLALLEGRIKQG